jgi:hypothetical protein
MEPGVCKGFLLGSRGEPNTWKKMIAYCNNDIVLLEKIYFKLRGWQHQTYPDLRPLLLFESVCPTCQSSRI